MHALWIDGGRLTLRDDVSQPEAPGEAIVRVRLAGICNTDLELTRGYMGFRGVPGHEFVGEVVSRSGPLASGTRVVGEINAGCGSCNWCVHGLQRHCPGRTVLGILNRSGSHAEYLSLPWQNLHPVHNGLSDDLAVFTEPLAAAYEVLEQRPPLPEERVLVLGDGKLGLLVAAVLQAEGHAPVLAGRHARKLDIARRWGIETVERCNLSGRDWDYVVECTGSAAGLGIAAQLVRPRGTIVLKSTVAGDTAGPLASLVIDEIAVIGSRCGPFPRALAGFERLSSAGVRLTDLIDDVLPLRDGVRAYERAASRGALKVLLRP
jgi:alcohol dehydrogenase